MSTDVSDQPGTSRRVRHGGGAREEREKIEEESVERTEEGADHLRDRGSRSQGVTGGPVVQRDLLIQREITQRELIIQRQLSIQINIVRLCVVILTLLFAIFAVRTTEKVVDYNSANNNLTLERERFQSKALQELQTMKDDLTQKIIDLERQLRQAKSETTLKPCPEGWKPFGCSCYYRSTGQKKTWEESSKECSVIDAHLMIINSPAEEEYIRNWQSAVKSWLGLKKKTGSGTWKWMDGTPMINANWTPGKPGSYVDWNCAEYQHSDGKWADAKCDAEMNDWICEKGRSS